MPLHSAKTDTKHRAQIVQQSADFNFGLVATKATIRVCRMAFCRCLSWLGRLKGIRNLAKLLMRPPALILARDFIKKSGWHGFSAKGWLQCAGEKTQMGMDQYLLIPFLGGWTSIYHLFWCSPGVQGFDTLPNMKLWTPEFLAWQAACCKAGEKTGCPWSAGGSFRVWSKSGFPSDLAIERYWNPGNLPTFNIYSQAMGWCDVWNPGNPGFSSVR